MTYFEGKVLQKTETILSFCEKRQASLRHEGKFVEFDENQKQLSDFTHVKRITDES